MAIVDTNSDAFDAISGLELSVTDPIRNRARLLAAIGTVANAAGDSNGSLYRLFALPSRAILRPETQIDLQNWGYAAATIGLARNRGATLTANGLLASVTVSGLAAPSVPIALFGAKWGMPVWEQAGLASDPGGLVDVIIATAADAAGAGTATFDAIWQID